MYGFIGETTVQARLVRRSLQEGALGKSWCFPLTPSANAVDGCRWWQQHLCFVMGGWVVSRHAGLIPQLAICRGTHSSNGDRQTSMGDV